jgi:hypothetical protein
VVSGRPTRQLSCALAGILLAACGHVEHRLVAEQVGSSVADSLGNTVIGGPGLRTLAFRFRPTWTGSVVGIRCYVIVDILGRAGYSAGSGGVLRVAVEPERPGGHVPSGTALAAVAFRPQPAQFVPFVRFPRSARVRAGQAYYVVFTNVDPDPQHNFASVNALYSRQPSRNHPPVPHDLAVLQGTAAHGTHAARWQLPQAYHLPILDVVGRDQDQHVGMGYVEVWRESAKPIGGRAAVRQLLSIAAVDRHIRGAWVRLRRLSRPEAPLAVRFERTSGSLFGAGTVAASEVPAGSPGWVWVRFDKPVLIPAWASVAMTLTAAEARSYEAFPLRKGVSFGFAPGTVFEGGYAQFNDGRGWTGWDQWGGHDERNSDLQFALDVQVQAK